METFEPTENSAQPVSAGYAVTAQNLAFSYGTTEILKDVTLKVKFGEVVGLLGPNGTGKSTLVALMAGDLSPANGFIKYGEKLLNDYTRKELAQTRAVMPQSTDFPFSYSVYDIVAMGRHCWEANPALDNEIISQSMSKTDVSHFVNRDVTRLSGGEKARVTFARVLTQKAGVVFLDEPTAALDIAHQERTMEICKELANAGHAVIAVMHDLQLAGSYCDQIALLDNGNVAAFGSPAEVLTAERLSRVYNWPIDTFTLPNGRLVVLPQQREKQY
ncbi:heme ABC transporter ATP-binding protein [Gleimia sp. 6138-11-ORH1]|uniref:heme ABC transporter ATP-binding protein n=1 Tax=Gleimia sp. 6138-11-ORH1 TaxID=2973937 RepID=UPI0021689345|nr:heme ABC transporter ATP-binding protein [Gleimia sp. 6138-11-ORH1]MCS4484388.1 heme ABC transporter ATP-binding protein [Gleimia sp. 6138-11-ORH1]